MSEKPFIDQIQDHVMGMVRMQNDLQRMVGGASEIDWSNPEAAKREVRHLQNENDELRDLMRSMENSQDRIEGDLSRKLEEAQGRIAELERLVKHNMETLRLWEPHPQPSYRRSEIILRTDRQLLKGTEDA